MWHLKVSEDYYALFVEASPDSAAVASWASGGRFEHLSLANQGTEGPKTNQT